jgi:hypothetical protein
MAGEEEDIFQAGSSPEDVAQPTDTEAQALSKAIEDVARQGGRPAAPPPPPPQPEAKPPTPQPETNAWDNRVPLATLLEERERRQALAQQLARYQEQEKAAARPPINQRLFEEPEAVLNEYRDALLREAIMPMQQQMQQMQIQHDMSLASVRHQDVWGDAWKSWYERVGTGQDPVTYFRVMNAPSPGEELVAWFKEQRIRSEVGDDPAAYREKLKAEILAELQGGMEPQRAPNGQFTTPAQQVRLPTATSRIGNSAKRGNEDDDDGSEEAIFESAARRRR